jgi:hypothetical protein
MTRSANAKKSPKMKDLDTRGLSSLGFQKIRVSVEILRAAAKDIE